VSKDLYPENVLGFYFMKKCKKCDIEKSLDNFYKNKSQKDGRAFYCKECDKKSSKQYPTDYNKWKEYYKDHYANNKSKRLSNNKKSVSNRSEDVKEYQKKWKQNKRKNDIEYRLRDVIQSRINYAVRHYKFNRSDSSIELLGCTIKEYFLYLEKQFDENMNWENYGTYWEIDHTIPLSKGGSFHYTNTTPMIIFNNRSKGNRNYNLEI
jgi:hypothetical protein